MDTPTLVVEAVVPPAAEPGVRVAQRFRHAVRAGRVNPLFYLVSRHAPCEDAPGNMTERTGRTRSNAPGVAALPVSQALSADAVIAGVRELPALPVVVMELIRSFDDADVSVEQLARRIARDQALAAKTLRLANSSFYGRSRQVESIAEAASLLGLRTLRNLALATGLATASQRTACAGFDFSAFWRHSIGTALCAGLLASQAHEARLDEGLAFTAALLHDIGRLALATSFAAPYAQALRYRAEADCELLDAERAVLGTDHAAVGRLVAEHWGFAPGIVEVIATHHTPRPPAGLGPRDDAIASVADVVHVADNIAHALGLSQEADDLVPALSMAAWSRLGLDERRCLDLLAQTQAQHAVLCEVLDR